MLTVLALAVATALGSFAVPADLFRLGTEADGIAVVSDPLTRSYAQRDAPGVRRLYETAGNQEDRLLAAYRLFAMTQDQSVIRDIPTDRGVEDARELALISALWAFRAGTGPRINLPTHGRRSERILNRAREIAPNEPYVLLVRGQSLYYKPRVFGGDVREAKRTFERLKQRMQGRSVPGIHAFEAEVWIWMCERKLDRASADAMKERLLARNPPPLFRQFLLDPP